MICNNCKKYQYVQMNNIYFIVYDDILIVVHINNKTLPFANSRNREL